MATSNYITAQVGAVTGSYIPLPQAYVSGLLITATEDLYVNIGNDTPADGTSFLLPAGVPLEMLPAPAQVPHVKAVSAATQVYILGS